MWVNPEIDPIARRGRPSWLGLRLAGITRGAEAWSTCPRNWEKMGKSMTITNINNYEYVMGKTYGFRWRFSLKPIYWTYLNRITRVIGKPPHSRDLMRYNMIYWGYHGISNQPSWLYCGNWCNGGLMGTSWEYTLWLFNMLWKPWPLAGSMTNMMIYSSLHQTTRGYSGFFRILCLAPAVHPQPTEMSSGGNS